jgi:hypothetical protein
MQPQIAQDLSISNAVMIKGSVTYPGRPNVGITLPHKRWRWSRLSRPQCRVDPDATTLVRQHRRNDLVPQVAAPHSTRTHRVNDDDLQISDPAEIAEVDRFGLDPEFP